MAKMGKKRKRVIIIVVVIALILAGGAGTVAAVKFGGGDPVNVYSMWNIAMDGYWGDVSETEGLVRTDNMQSVYISGTQQVVEVLVTEGQTVKEGDVLAVFDTTLSDIELERQRLTVEKTELMLNQAKKDLNVINGYKPYVPPAPEPEPEPEELEPMALPFKEGGQGTEEKPFVYLWNDDCWYTESFINSVLPLEIAPVVPETPETPETPEVPETPENPEDSETPETSDEPEAQTETEGEGETPETPETPEVPETPESPEVPENPDALETPETPESPETPETPETPEDPETPENPTEPEKPEEPKPEEKPTYKNSSVWVVFEVRESDNTEGELIRYWGIRFTRNTDGSYKFAMYQPDPDYNKSEDEEEEPEPEISYPTGPQYTASEIAQMRAQKQREIRDLELQLRVEKVKYEKLKLELESGVIYAKLDGTVKTVANPDEAQMYGTPFIVVSGGGGYYIQGTLSELELDTIHVGQTVTVISWMNYAEIEGEIVDISTFPTTDGYNWSNGNQNVSFYPFTVFVSEDAALQENEYVSIQYSPAETGSGIYLEMPFVVTENSKSYVYVADAEGKLEKREVTTGKSLWGSYIEITSGLTMDDLIAFPYGKDIKEGADTVEAGIEELYSATY
ncbi:MAG: biotin/lipoyl-binding protein [Oscillospiraceae bacterium]|nr:biotin/lipoyl-binding protein [Oscillospiraceae bacterium]